MLPVTPSDGWAWWLFTGREWPAAQAIRWYPHPELNGNPRFRKPLLYPFELWGLSRAELKPAARRRQTRCDPQTSPTADRLLVILEPRADLGFQRFQIRFLLRDGDGLAPLLVQVAKVER